MTMNEPQRYKLEWQTGRAILVRSSNVQTAYLTYFRPRRLMFWYRILSWEDLNFCERGTIVHRKDTLLYIGGGLKQGRRTLKTTSIKRQALQQAKPPESSRGAKWQPRLTTNECTKQFPKVRKGMLIRMQAVVLHTDFRAHGRWTIVSEIDHGGWRDRERGWVVQWPSGGSRDHKRDCFFPHSTPFPALNCGSSSRRILINHFFLSPSKGNLWKS